MTATPAGSASAAPAPTPANSDAAAGAATAHAFEQIFGYRPAGVWAAPGRVNIIGEHTDYNDGFVLPIALPHTTRAAVAPREDRRIRLHSAGIGPLIHDIDATDLPPRLSREWTAYPLGVVWALRDAGHDIGGFDIHLDSTVPTGAGLSSSAALECSVALAVNDLHSLNLARPELALLAQRAENGFVGVPCGAMDQMASACCAEGHALYLDTRDLTQRQVPFDLAAEGLALLVVDTQVKHDLADGAYAERRQGCESAAAALGLAALRDVAPADLAASLEKIPSPDTRRLVRHIVTENGRVERVVARLDAADPCSIGALLTEGHASLRDDYRVSCAELDLVVDVACANGALGARMTGGGFGGSAIVLVEVASADAVSAAVTAAFADAGWQPPRIFTAIPAAGARRVG